MQVGEGSLDDPERAPEAVQRATVSARQPTRVTPPPLA
jgi:hypothetical protein